VHGYQLFPAYREKISFISSVPYRIRSHEVLAPLLMTLRLTINETKFWTERIQIIPFSNEESREILNKQAWAHNQDFINL